MNYIFLDHISRPIIRNNDANPKDTTKQTKVLIPVNENPVRDGMEEYQRRRQERFAREAVQIREYEKTIPQREKALDAREKQLKTREAKIVKKELEIMEKEQLLKEFAPEEWKQIEENRIWNDSEDETGYQPNEEQNINLSHSAADTTAHIAMNKASLPGTEDTQSSPAGSFMMICTALFLCIASGLLYRKRQQ